VQHHALLEEILRHSEEKSFAKVLAGMPNVGKNEGFERMNPSHQQIEDRHD